MSQPRNRWIVQVILVLAVLTFVGISLVPIFGAFNQQSPATQDAASNKSNLLSSDQQKKLEDEARGYELVLQREPDNQTALKGLLQARLELLKLKQGNIQGVIEPLEKLAKLNPNQTDYGVLLAQAKQQINDNEGAAQVYRSILQTKPGDLDALQGMVTLLLSQQRPEAAIELLQGTLTKAAQANTTQPGSVDTVAVQILLGNVHASQKRYTQAISSYDQAIARDAKDFRPVLTKAMLLKEQGKIAEAKPLFDNASALAPAQYKDQINKLASASPTPTPSASPAPIPSASPAPTPEGTPTP